MDLSATTLNNLLKINTSQGQVSAKQNLQRVKRYIDNIAGLEAQYSYDYKSLDNLSLLFEEQADIFAKAAKQSTAFNSPTLSQNEILSKLLSTDSSIISDAV